MKKIESGKFEQSKDNKIEIRAQAVFAMFGGESVKTVSEQFKIGRGSLYKLRRRAIEAVRREMENPVVKERTAHNRLSREKEDKVVRIC